MLCLCLHRSFSVKIRKKQSVRDLADTVVSVGLLHNLLVHTLPDGRLGVVAGGAAMARRGRYCPYGKISIV